MWLVMAMVSAWADTVVLDDGTELRAHIVTWNDDCTLAVDEGPLAEAWVVLPCARIARYSRDAQTAAPVARIEAAEAPAAAAQVADATEAESGADVAPGSVAAVERAPVEAAAEAPALALPVQIAPASDDPDDQPLVDPSGVEEVPLESDAAPATPLVDLTWREAMVAVQDRIRAIGR